MVLSTYYCWIVWRRKSRDIWQYCCDWFEVHKVDCTKCVFKPYKKGLFNSSVNNDVVLVTTVEDKINKYTVIEYSNAKTALELQSIIGRPSTHDLIDYEVKNIIPNSPVTRQDKTSWGQNWFLDKILGKKCVAQKHLEVKLQDILQEIIIFIKKSHS